MPRFSKNAVRRRPCAAHLAHEWRLLGWTAAEAESVRVAHMLGCRCLWRGAAAWWLHALAQLGGQCGGSTVVARLWWLDSLGPTVCGGSTAVARQRWLDSGGSTAGAERRNPNPSSVCLLSLIKKYLWTGVLEYSLELTSIC